MIKHFEGLRLLAYKCPAGVLTIGYGHTGKDVQEGMTITEKQAEQYLISDMQVAIRGVDRLVTAPLSQK